MVNVNNMQNSKKINCKLPLQSKEHRLKMTGDYHDEKINVYQDDPIKIWS